MFDVLAQNKQNHQFVINIGYVKSKAKIHKYNTQKSYAIVLLNMSVSICWLTENQTWEII